MDEAMFRREADKALEQLKQALIRAEDAMDEPLFETEEKNGVLNVLFEDGSAKFVFSPNAPVAQVWISALSTSFKLEWDTARSVFVLPKTGEELMVLTQRLLREQTGNAELTLQ